jgi:hypothetical protein
MMVIVFDSGVLTTDNELVKEASPQSQNLREAHGQLFFRIQAAA